MPIRPRFIRTLVAASLAAAAFAVAFATHPAAAQTYKDLTYFTVPPCVAADTRVIGGAFGVNETRTYAVTGSGSFSGQGGSSSGCGVPAMSNNVAQIQAVNLNVIAIATSAAGFLEVFAADKSSSVSLLDFPASGVVSTNVVVPVNQTSSVTGDIKVTYAGAGGHLLVSVTGYYAIPQQTVLVHPVPGNATAAGTALLNAFSSLAALTGSIAPSSTRHYEVKLDPGLYNIGTSPLNLLSHVDLVGAGQQASIIQGTGYEAGLTGGSIVGTSITDAEVRDLQVQPIVASGSDSAIGIFLGSSPITVQNVTVNATAAGASANAIGICSFDANVTLQDLQINASGGGTTNGIVVQGISTTFPVVRRAVVSASGASGFNVGMYYDEGANPTFLNLEVSASGGSTAVALQAGFDGGFVGPTNLQVTDSTLQASGATFNYGIDVTGTQSGCTFHLDNVKAIATSGTSYGLSDGGFDTHFVNRSELNGGTRAASVPAGLFNAGSSLLAGGVSAGVAVCSASYNGSYAALSSACL